jgi:hypothetical protein
MRFRTATVTRKVWYLVLGTNIAEQKPPRLKLQYQPFHEILPRMTPEASAARRRVQRFILRLFTPRLETSCAGK